MSYAGCQLALEKCIMSARCEKWAFEARDKVYAQDGFLKKPFDGVIPSRVRPGAPLWFPTLPAGWLADRLAGAKQTAHSHRVPH
jgi:hypothetical protein